MAHAILVVNPAAGRAVRLGPLCAMLERKLAAQGYSISLIETMPGLDAVRPLAHTIKQIVEQHRPGDLVLACGGDGTVHAVVQALAGTQVPLGILPFGTHNALTRSLGLPRDPAQALARLLTWQPRVLPLGEIVSDSGTRFFLLMAAAGPAGALAHQLARPSRWKRTFGRSAYPIYAARLMMTARWPRFQVDYRLRGAAEWQTTTAVSLLVSRVPSLGGMFGGLTPHAALGNPHLHAHVLRAPAQLALPAWLARMPNPWLEVLDAGELRCTPLDGSRPILLQADAEPLGALPCTLRVRPAALHLLMPPPEADPHREHDPDGEALRTVPKPQAPPQSSQ